WRAQLALRAAQLALGPITYVQDPARPEGVLAVQPSGYTLPGTPVLLTINGEPDPFAFPDRRAPLPGVDGLTPGDVGPGSQLAGQDGAAEPSDGARQVPFTFDPTFVGVRRLLEEPYRLRLVIDDERGERTALDQRLAAGEILSTTVSVYGDEAL